MNSLMTAQPIGTISRADDFDARTRRIRARILDGIEETLDELTGHDALRATIRDENISNEIRRAARTHCAALLCRQALCRRAKTCRRQPCAVVEEATLHSCDASLNARPDTRD